MDIVFLSIIGCALLALIYALKTGLSILSASPGDTKMQEIATTIQLGARTYLNRQYMTIGSVGLLVALILAYCLSLCVAIGFIIGAVLSGLAGYIGMTISVRANVRTAEAAKIGLPQALSIAFKSGAITGLLVIGLGLLGITLYYKILLDSALDQRSLLDSLIALGFGASLISIFARLGGGIFTKGADVGADLVGKIELGIPEDDPRNPAVIADNVGDNVGDCAGMAADLFETYVVTIVGTMLLASIYFTGPVQSLFVTYPLMIGAACALGSVFGTLFVRPGKSMKIMPALYKGFIATALLSAGLIYLITDWVFNHLSALGFLQTLPFTKINILVCTLTGLGVTGVLILITEYYTSTDHHPVRSIAKASTTGHATNIIQGLAISMEATALPVIVISIGIIIAYMNANLFGISISATTMLALAGIIIALDAYGPVADNAGGIAEMSGLPNSVRKIMDDLDAAGNTTKAVTKGYAIGSAGFAALVLFTAFTEDLAHYFPHLTVDFKLTDPFVLIGLFLGGLLPYLFGAMCLKAVGRAGGSIVLEVRRQFNEIKGIMEGTAQPDYSRAIDLLTKSAIREMILPSFLPVLAPILAYLTISTVIGKVQAFLTLGALLIGTIITGLFVAISMTSGGGAWDNAKKYIEDGHFGGKGSESHKAAITGDTVGDPYKDTAGPAINPMIKIINIVAILLLSFLSH